MFERVENGVKKISLKQKTPKILDQKQRFSMGNFHFFGRGKTNVHVQNQKGSQLPR